MSSAKKTEIDLDSFLSEQAHTREQMRYRERLLKLLQSQHEILPAADSPLGRLWVLVNSEDSSIHECVEVIRLDPALTSRVFRLANSAAYGGTATTVAEAVLHLGFAQVRQVAFTAGIFEQFLRLQLPLGWDHSLGWDQFWVRNLFISRLMERIAALYFLPTGSEYLAGLLHDTGWLLIASSFPEELKIILSDSRLPPESERAVLSFSHEEIAAAICARSLFPFRVVNAVIYHHHPRVVKTENLSLRESAAFLGVLLYICDGLADSCGLRIFNSGEVLTLEALQKTPEAEWLAQLGAPIDFPSLIEEELPKAKEILSIFLTDHH